ncbi:hypothetical protein NG99_24650 [Erwinia typographi]|uniref:Uncharacterized protein n=1 Tax=Erwinia typographi TaxID=371042 RepID=A0A0A3ZM23_9GAMM|nr:hypothetical protein [Erwinia typographi]KGT86793.1 hypothetical protein NG99_24650 [Erwinia typographi]
MNEIKNDSDLLVSILDPISSWPDSWCGVIPYSLEVQVTDSAYNPQQNESIIVTCEESVEITQLNSPVTNVAGAADILVDLSNAKAGMSLSLDVSVEAESTNLGEVLEDPSVDVYILSDTYDASVKFPAAVNGIVNDDVFDSETLEVTVILTNSQEGMSTSNDIVLYWGDYVVRSPAITENQYATFDLSGREELFQNGTYKYAVSVVDVAGNASFSNIGVVVVQRANSAGSNPYLNGIDIPVADNNNGYINRVQNNNQLVEVRFNGKDPVTLDDGTIIETPFIQADSGTFFVTGYNTDGVVVANVSKDLSSYVGSGGSNDYFTINMEKEVSPSFFNKIGIGRATFSYNLTINGVNYSVIKDQIKTYNVNVTGP